MYEKYGTAEDSRNKNVELKMRVKGFQLREMLLSSCVATLSDSLVSFFGFCSSGFSLWIELFSNQELHYTDQERLQSANSLHCYVFSQAGLF